MAPEESGDGGSNQAMWGNTERSHLYSKNDRQPPKCLKQENEGSNFTC